MLDGRYMRASRPAGHRHAAGKAARHRLPEHAPIAPRPVPPAQPDGAQVRPWPPLPAVVTLTLPRPAVLPVSPQRAAQALTTALAALIVIGVTGLITFFIVADERRDRAVAAPAISADRLASRTTDPAPLTLQEVFPDPDRVRPPGGTQVYRVTMTHIDSECGIATTGNLGGVLAGRGCSQVVRASLTAPYGDYQVTAGLFNLADAAGATAVDGQLRELVETGDGSFAAMASGEPAAPAATVPPGQVGWHARGHYLLYCVITRPGGELIPDTDPAASRITADLIDGYLGTQVLGRRAGRGPSPGGR